MKEELLKKLAELKNSPKTQEAKQEVNQKVKMAISKAKEFIQSIRNRKENLGPQA